jgi:hypothetical protein
MRKGPTRPDHVLSITCHPIACIPVYVASIVVVLGQDRRECPSSPDFPCHGINLWSTWMTIEGRGASLRTQSGFTHLAPTTRLPCIRMQVGLVSVVAVMNDESGFSSRISS